MFVHGPQFPVQVAQTHVRSASLSVYVLTAVNDGWIGHFLIYGFFCQQYMKLLISERKNWQPNDHNLIYVNVFIIYTLLRKIDSGVRNLAENVKIEEML